MDWTGAIAAYGLHLGSYILPFLVVLTILVFIHELGHYLVARRCGVRVEKFSIGFGPELFGRTDRAGTRWSFSVIPLGGYVKMLGDADASSRPDPAVAAMRVEERAQTLHAKPVGQRAAILVAGPAANYLFAILLMGLMLCFSRHPLPPPVVKAVAENSAAQEAGFLPGDRVLKVNGQPVYRFAELSRMVLQGGTEASEFEVSRDGETLMLRARPRMELRKDVDGRDVQVPALGLLADNGPWGPVQAFRIAAVEAVDLSWMSLSAIAGMLAGQRSTEELGGVIRIAELSGNAASAGILPFLWLMAFLSISLGLMNLLPIPVLDGGHLLFCALEAVRRRPLSPKVQEYGFRIGFALVLSLLVFVLYNDLSRY
ncbi:MAG: RIP metalloprotease RseP [Pseudomonadota bacterium]|nr:RIP metalloprotease RseP [Pseudomonadota bacterium]